VRIIGSLALALAGLVVTGVGANAARESAKAPSQSRMKPLPPAEIDDGLTIGGDDIEARQLRTRMTVGVKVNGQGPYKFVVDSGADSSVVGQRIAAAQTLPAGTPVILNAITASSRVNRVLVDEIEVGPSTIRNLEVPALDERFIGGEGMLGIDALVEQRLMLDFEDRLIKVEDARKPAPRMDGEIIVTARMRGGQLILTKVAAAGLPLEAVVDTGSEITIGNIALRDKIMRHHPDKFVTVEVTGVTGVKLPLQMARIGEVKLGSVTLRNVPIAFADVPPFRVFGLDKGPALLLGTDLMETFRRVSLDFRARKVRFQLRKCGSQGIVIRSGPTQGITRLSSEDNAAVCKR
jgi:hypothetical protein